MADSSGRGNGLVPDPACQSQRTVSTNTNKMRSQKAVIMTIQRNPHPQNQEPDIVSSHRIITIPAPRSHKVGNVSSS